MSPRAEWRLAVPDGGLAGEGFSKVGRGMSSRAGWRLAVPDDGLAGEGMPKVGAA